MSDQDLITQAEPRLRRRPPPKRSKLRNLPITIRYGLPLALIALLLVAGYRSWVGSFTYVSVVNAARAPVTSGMLEFFVFDDSSAAPSPTAKVGEMPFEGAEPVEVSSELVGGPTLVRVRAAGYGVGSAYVTRNRDVQVCDLGEPMAVRGKVLAPGGAPAEGARVQAMGGGPHGVLLAEAETNSAGQFEIGGLSSTLAHVMLRVFYPEAVVLQQDAWFDTEEPAELQLELTRPVSGRVVLPPGLEASGLRVLAFSVPGVEAEVAADGTFELDHLPAPPTRVRLLAGPLPTGYTHGLTTAIAGDRNVEIEIERSATVEGQVVDGATMTGLTGASVQHDYGPRGGVTVPCDEVGNFRIDGLPSGEVTLRAIIQVRAADPVSRQSVLTSRTATRTVELEAGEERQGVGIVLR